ncbi:MAG: sensor histidine kinase [Eubacterium sp.]|nr:sensor histidine kinase [Eubacterium sp.]
MRRSVVIKLFLIIVLFMTFCFGSFIAGQTLFFEKMYLNTKISNLEKALNSFGNAYTNEKWDNKAITQKINEFTNENNAQIAILDKDGMTKYMPSFSIVMETDEKKKLEIPLNSIAFLEDFQKLELSVGSQIEVDGYFSDDLEKFMSVSGIKKDGKSWTNSNIKLVSAKAAVQGSPVIIKNSFKVQKSNSTTAAGDVTVTSATGPVTAIKDIINIETINPEKITGKIVLLNLPDQIQQIANYNSGLLWSAIDYWNQLMMVNKTGMGPGKTASFHYSDINNGMDNIAFVKPVLKNNQISEYVFAISSLQPVGEAVEAMKAYYGYVFFIVVLLMLIMAFIFSRSISKPLLKMNTVAQKMADLDFTEECPVKSKDELGNLALSLNSLSKNLSLSLGDLKAANKQLKLDIEKERSLENMRKEFVSSVSHEFKTPLGIIKGFAEGFKDNIAEEKKDYYIDVILDEVEKMDELVMDLLDLAKLESKAYELNKEEFSIADLVDEVEARLDKSMTEKNISLIIDHGDKSFQVYADRRRIEQVITNILGNAIRHTMNSGSIKVLTEKIENKLWINIENSGEQIAEADLQKIWERFYRVEKSRGRKAGGTGLGLSIVKNILELHGSEYGVKNTTDGVSFYFSL